MTPADRLAAIRQRLEATLRPREIEVIDESHKHRGHAGARDGSGHFQVRIVSDAFRGCGRVERHRLVYAALGELLQTEIHALAIEALSVDEADGAPSAQSRNTVRPGPP
jgi:BolA protein